MPALCWHSTPAYYAIYYAGIFDGGILKRPIDHLYNYWLYEVCKDTICVHTVKGRVQLLML